MYYISCHVKKKTIPFCQLHLVWDGFWDIPFPIRFLCGHPSNPKSLQPAIKYLQKKGIKAKILKQHCPTTE